MLKQPTNFEYPLSLEEWMKEMNVGRLYSPHSVEHLPNTDPHMIKKDTIIKMQNQYINQ